MLIKEEVERKSCGGQYIPVVEVLHEIDFCLEGVDLFLEAAPEAYLLHGEQLPGALVQSFEHLFVGLTSGWVYTRRRKVRLRCAGYCCSSNSARNRPVI